MAFLSIACLLTVSAISAQQYNFTRFSEKDGLRNNIIFSLLKDKYGYLWIGTQNGLNRFDGAHFTVFKKNKSNTSIPNNSVHTLCEDKEGNIWGGTENGIFCYSYSTNRFITYNKPAAAISNYVSNILCDAKGDIYTAGIVDIMKLDRKTNSFEVLVSLTQSKDSIDSYAFGKNKLLMDEAGTGLWVSTSRGLVYYDLQQKRLLNADNSPGIPLFSYRNTGAVGRSAKGKIWFYDKSSKAIRLFDPQTKKEIRSISCQHLPADYSVATILEDRKGKLWLSSWNNQFYVVDTKNGDKIEKIEVGSDANNTLFFWAALEDENGSIWLGTLTGISIFTPERYIYKSCRLATRIPGLKDNIIINIEENPYDKTWWILTANNIIIQYDPATAVYKEYRIETPQLKGIGVISVATPQIGFLDHQPVLVAPDRLWVLKRGASQFTPYQLLPDDFADFHIEQFIETDQGIYLTDGHQLLEWKRGTKSARWINIDPNGLLKKKGLSIKSLHWIPGKPLFWSFSKDYIGFLPANGQPELVRLTQENSGDIRSYFHYPDMDRNGNMWVNNKGVGLYRYQLKNRQISFWSEFDGLADNHFHSVKADDKGNIWLLYFNKATVFNEERNSFVNFDIPYSENYFNYYNRAVKRSDGVVMGTIANEVFEFRADNLNLAPVNRSPHLSVINVDGEDHLITNQKEMLLEPDQNSLRLKFGFMPDAGIFPHYFEYKLDGVDKNWVSAASSREAVFNNLAPGKYVFHLVAKGKNSAWESEEIRFVIVIKTPFYKTLWFYIAIFALFLLALYLLYRYRMYHKEKMMNLENKANALEKEKALVMYEGLKQQLNPHFLFNSLTSLNSLISSDPRSASSFLDSLSKTYRYILKSRENETVALGEELKFAENYIKLQQTRFEKGFEVSIDVPEEYHHRKIVPVTLQNLVENTIKHNIIDEESPLRVSLFIQEDYLVVKNNLQKKNFVETSNKQGLSNLLSLYSYLSNRPLLIQEENDSFIVKIPLL